MTLETEERDRCLRGLVLYLSDSEQTVMSVEEPRALSVRTTLVPLSWDVCPWMPPRISSLPEPPVTFGSPSPYTAPSGALFLLPCRPLADLRTSFSIRSFLKILPYTPGVWHTARSDPYLSSPMSRSSARSVSPSRSPSLSSEEEQLLESLLNVTVPVHHVVSLLR